MPKVLVVEDDRLTRTMVCTNRRHAGFDVVDVDRCSTAMECLQGAAFDAVVLDYMLPGPDGLTLLKHMRTQGVGTPVLMLTARDEMALKVRALGLGADDYLTKPFHVDELVARVHALVRRARAPIEVPARGRVPFANGWVDIPNRRLEQSDGEVHVLGEKEAGMIALFCREPGHVFSRADILDEVWGMDAKPIVRTVDNYIGALRRLVEPDADAPQYIVTVRGEGYRYDAQ
jgi:DNA-binding response OmpR family regulator